MAVADAKALRASDLGSALAPPVRWQLSLKRAFDLAVGVPALLVAGPVLLVMMLMIWIESPAAPIFRQRRLGLDGREFWMLKLRTMVPNAEAMRAQLEHLNEAPPLFKITNDPRVTRVGRFLRATSMDELPQLLNVVRGEMSLVGPRPRLPHEFDLSVPRQRQRFIVKPGLAGLWQVRGRAKLGFEEALEVDLEYIRRWSFVFDLELIARTAWVVVTGRGAY
ncbi:MAG TPA: sugar transferase [Candidatus Dormibacteraeota bacterium]|nr:sugar transferase [Candidatus Dormibacteraeota bacterium]